MKVIDGFTIGGTKNGPSMPGAKLQRMLGSRIAIDIESQTLYVPTKQGIVQARRGDRVLLYDDNSLEVERHEQRPHFPLGNP